MLASLDVAGIGSLAGCSVFGAFVGADDGVLAAVDADDGGEQWSVTVDDWVRTDPVVDRTVFAGSD